MIMTKLKSLQKIALLLVVGITLCAVYGCDDDIDENNSTSGLNGWYTNLSSLAKQSDFYEINKAIRNNEVLSSYHYGGKKHEYIASRDLFINSEGIYSDTAANLGRLRFSVSSVINVIRILDDNTLLFYIGYLCEDGVNAGEALYSFYAGSIFGQMTYYGTPTYYTYARVDNKLIVSNGDIYTVTSGGLIRDGSSSLWSKYDPKK